MLTIEKCREILNDNNISEERIKIIRDYLYSLCKEIVAESKKQYE